MQLRRLGAWIGLSIACSASTTTEPLNEAPGEQAPKLREEEWTAFALPHPVDARWFLQADGDSMFAPSGILLSPAARARAASYRSESVDGKVMFARDFAASPLALALEGSDDFVYCSEDGTVYRSPSAAGPLTVVGAAPPSERVGLIDDTLFGLASDGNVWSLPAGASEVTVVHEAAASMATGQGILYLLDETGGVHKSTNGGASFDALDLPECVEALHSGLDGEAYAERGLYRYRLNGAHVDPDPVPVPYVPVADIAAHYAPAIRVAQMVRLDDGTLAALQGRRAFEADSGAPLFDVAPGCALKVAGSQVFRVCRDASDKKFGRVARWTPDGWIEAIPDFLLSSVVLGSSGQFAGVTRSAAPLQSWHRFNGARMQPIDPKDVYADNGKFKPVALAEPWLVGQVGGRLRATNLESHSRRVLADDVRGTVSVVEGGLVLRPYRERVRRESHRDSPFGDEPYRFWVGHPNEGMTPRTLPAGASGFAMASVTRGLAVGVDASAAWVTTDGAASWQRLELPITGNAAAMPLGENVACTNAACLAAPFVWADVGGLLEPPPLRVRIVAPSTPKTLPKLLLRAHCGGGTDPGSRAIPGAEHAVSCTSDRRCSIDLSWLSRLQPGDLAKQARIVPSQKNGETQGFKLYGIRRGSLPKLLQLKNGDMIVRVGKIKLRGLDQARAAMDAVRKRGEVELEIERKGKRFVYILDVR